MPVPAAERMRRRRSRQLRAAALQLAEKLTRHEVPPDEMITEQLQCALELAALDYAQAAARALREASSRPGARSRG